MTIAAIRRATLELLAKIGLNGEFEMSPLPGGTNNRVYRVTVGECSYLVKAYFQHKHDLRDRLQAEFSFIGFGWECGLRCLPRPLACDSVNGLGLYEFVTGRVITAAEVTGTLVDQAVNFYRALNQNRHRPEAQQLPHASDSCFSLGEHLMSVERRMKRLRAIGIHSPLHQQASQFISGEVADAWDRVSRQVRSRASELQINEHEVVGQADRLISPSDFGFHNALCTPEGRLCFLDFEYAGWDDPVKMICDFFNQPAVPVPVRFFEGFAKGVLADLADPGYHLDRANLLMPIHLLKWCCILMNDFLPMDSERRQYALGSADPKERKANQIEKAQSLLRSALEVSESMSLDSRVMGL